LTYQLKVKLKKACKPVMIVAQV